jgi:hypothetical protein
MNRTCVTDPLPLMILYLDGGKGMSNDEREIMENRRDLRTGLVAQAIRQMSHPPAAAPQPQEGPDALQGLLAMAQRLHRDALFAVRKDCEAATTAELLNPCKRYATTPKHLNLQPTPRLY